MKKYILPILIVLFFSCNEKVSVDETFNTVAEDYVKLVLEIGLYDANFVDAYYGPEEWKPESLENSEEEIPESDFLNRIQLLNEMLLSITVENLDENQKLRHIYLAKQLKAIKGRVEMLSGKVFSFDEETDALYDVVTPTYEVEHFESLIKELDEALPGKGSVSERLAEFKSQFIIPKDKLDIVFNTAIQEARKRTLQFITLPENENFVLEFVSDKPWGGYNWYKGNNFSLIQINTDSPIFIDRAIDLASHEGYPGHHVYNCLLETNMVKKNNWIEFSVYPLFSPQSLIAEGTANYGIEMAFPENEKIDYEKEVLFPLAGIDAVQAEKYYEITDLVSKISYVRNAASKAYLNGDRTKEETVDWLVKYALRDRKGAEQSLKFVDVYRSYIINYNYGLDLVREYMKTENELTEEEKWKRFEYLISTPQVPSNLIK
jgi:hypothetical protein